MFVDALTSVTDSARQRARDVVMAFDTRDLEKKRQQLLTMIGSRIVQVRRAGLVDLTRDDKLVEMIDDVAQIDRAIASVAENSKRPTGGCGGDSACCQERPCQADATGAAAVATEPS